MRLRRWRTADLALAVSLLLAGAAASDSTLFECPKGRYRILSYYIVFSRLSTFPPKGPFTNDVATLNNQRYLKMLTKADEDGPRVIRKDYER